jgi:hypothetical protein
LHYLQQSDQRLSIATKLTECLHVRDARAAPPVHYDGSLAEVSEIFRPED